MQISEANYPEYDVDKLKSDLDYDLKPLISSNIETDKGLHFNRLEVTKDIWKVFRREEKDGR